MAGHGGSDRPRRYAVLASVALLHGGLLALLLMAPAVRRTVPPTPLIEVVFRPDPPPPPPGGSEAPAFRLEPVRPSVAEPRIEIEPEPVPTPLRVSPLPSASGAPDGRAGVGQGSGSGQGAGTGDGAGAGRRPRWQSGKIENLDYPRGAARRNATGIVTVRFEVTPDGRPQGCRVVRSSGHDDLDTATCRLIEARFRYAPARDGTGSAVAGEAAWRQEWWLED